MKEDNTMPVEEEFIESRQKCELEHCLPPPPLARPHPLPQVLQAHACGQMSVEKRKALSNLEIQPITSIAPMC